MEGYFLTFKYHVLWIILAKHSKHAWWQTITFMFMFCTCASGSRQCFGACYVLLPPTVGAASSHNLSFPRRGHSLFLLTQLDGRCPYRTCVWSLEAEKHILWCKIFISRTFKYLTCYHYLYTKIQGYSRVWGWPQRRQVSVGTEACCGWWARLKSGTWAATHTLAAAFRACPSWGRFQLE